MSRNLLPTRADIQRSNRHTAATPAANLRLAAIEIAVLRGRQFYRVVSLCSQLGQGDVPKCSNCLILSGAAVLETSAGVTQISLSRREFATDS